jgi:hypothetical protein
MVANILSGSTFVIHGCECCSCVRAASQVSSELLRESASGRRRLQWAHAGEMETRNAGRRTVARHYKLLVASLYSVRLEPWDNARARIAMGKCQGRGQRERTDDPIEMRWMHATEVAGGVAGPCSSGAEYLGNACLVSNVTSTQFEWWSAL